MEKWAMSLKVLLALQCGWVLCQAAFYSRPSTKVVSTKYGVMRGLLTQFAPSATVNPNRAGSSLQAVESYLGIPYAAPPVGNLRFMPPTTPAQFDAGVRVATSFGPVCPQLLPSMAKLSLGRKRLDYLQRMTAFLKNQSEDCLYLNIYVPASARDEKDRLAVVIYIHGESYSWGSGNAYDGRILASYANIIVVTLNYRLGILGFLSTGDVHAQGNYALMDQVAAIRFVEENIGQFGGDPKSITLVGHGTGAACVNLLMLSPVASSSDQLFKRAVLLSGSAGSVSAISKDPRKYTLQLSAMLNCSHDDTSVDLVRCLKTKSLDQLLGSRIDPPQFLSSFGPSVDGIFIPNQPRIIMQQYASLYRKYGLMVGLTGSEANDVLPEKELIKGINVERHLRLLRTLVRNVYNHHLGEILLAIQFEYSEWGSAAYSTDPIILRDSIVDILSDGLVVAPLIEAAQMHAGAMAHETFMFVFQHPQATNSQEDASLSSPERVHSEILPYLFAAPLSPSNQISLWPANYSAQDAYVSEVMVTFLANYIMSGDPKRFPRKRNGGLSDAVHQAVAQSHWPLFNTEQQKYLHISARHKDTRHHYRGHKIGFWNELIPKLNEDKEDQSIPDSHHHFADFDRLDSYEGIVRVMNAVTLPPPPLPPSITPPPWRNRTKARATALLMTSTAKDHDLRVAAVDPEAQVLDSTSHLALSVTVAVGCTFLIVNIVACAGVYYQRRKLAVKNANEQVLPGKRNSKNNVIGNDAEHEKLTSNYLLSASSGFATFADSPDVKKKMDQERRTFNTFAEQKAPDSGFFKSSDESLPPLTLPNSSGSIFKQPPMDGHGSFRIQPDHLRKPLLIPHNPQRLDPIETDETAV